MNIKIYVKNGIVSSKKSNTERLLLVYVATSYEDGLDCNELINIIYSHKEAMRIFLKATTPFHILSCGAWIDIRSIKIIKEK